MPQKYILEGRALELHDHMRQGSGGQQTFDQDVVALYKKELTDRPKIELVDVFRRSDEAGKAVDRSDDAAVLRRRGSQDLHHAADCRKHGKARRQ